MPGVSNEPHRRGGHTAPSASAVEGELCYSRGKRFCLLRRRIGCSYNHPKQAAGEYEYGLQGLRERDIAIVGVAESDEWARCPHKSSLQHHAEAAHNALEDAGLSKNDVNGVLTAGFSTLVTAEYLGIQPAFTDSTYVGGSSFVIHVAPRRRRYTGGLLRRGPDNPRAGGPLDQGPGSRRRQLADGPV